MFIRECNGRPYVYESRRVRGKPRAKYLFPAHGDLPELIEASRAEDEARRRRERQERAEARAEAEAEERPVRELYEAVDRMVGAALEAAGYWRTNRGPWRRRRVETTTKAE